MEEVIQWYPLPEVEAAEESWVHSSTVVSPSGKENIPTHGHKHKTADRSTTKPPEKKELHTLSPSSSNHPPHRPARESTSHTTPRMTSTNTPPSDSVRPGDLSITSLLTVSPGNDTSRTRNTSYTHDRSCDTAATHHHHLTGSHTHNKLRHKTTSQPSLYTHRQGAKRDVSKQQQIPHLLLPPTESSEYVRPSSSAPRLTLDDLDRLWREFLTSSLATGAAGTGREQLPPSGGGEKGSKEGSLSGGTHREATTSKARCVCGAWKDGHTAEREQATDQSVRAASKEESIHRDSGTVKRGEYTGSRHKHRHRERVVYGSRECAVQTSPQPPPSLRAHTLPPAPAVTFALPPHDKAESAISHLTLSEALAVQYPEFIERSLQRQRRVREHRDHQGAWLCGRGRQDRPTPVGGAAPSRSLRSHPPIASGHYPKVSMKEMYQASKKVWQQLPEVRAKVKKEKQRSQAATNRLRVKMYQQEVLSRLRRKKQHM